MKIVGGMVLITLAFFLVWKGFAVFSTGTSDRPESTIAPTSTAVTPSIPMSPDSPAPAPTASAPMATRRPTPPPTPSVIIPFSNLEHADWLEQFEPERANELKEFSWVADGIDESERFGAEMLIVAGRGYPATFSALVPKPWLDDGVSADEIQAIEFLTLMAQDAPLLADRMLSKTWLQDEITRDEASVITCLYWITRSDDEAAGPRVVEAAIALLDMPFLDSVEGADAAAVWDLSNIAAISPKDFLDIVGHPKVSDGIADQEAKVVAVLSSAFHEESALLPVLLNGLDGTRGVYLEERVIQLPLAGETLLTIIRTRDQFTSSMDYLEHSVRFVEEFMGEPLPTSYVALYFGDVHPEGIGGQNLGTHMTMLQSSDDEWNTWRTSNVIAHEVAHYYWADSDTHWLDEGACELISFVSERERDGTLLETHVQTPCADVQTLERSEILGREECDYYLGGGFFLDLYNTLGEETFRPAFRRLHLKSQEDDPHDDCEGTNLTICHVKEAFNAGASDDVVEKVDEIVARWYGH